MTSSFRAAGAPMRKTIRFKRRESWYTIGSFSAVAPTGR